MLKPQKTCLWKCHKCNEAGNEFKLRTKLGDSLPNITSTQDAVYAQQKPEALPNIDAAHQALIVDDDAMEYVIVKRGWSRDVVNRMKLGVAEHPFDGISRRCIVFPYYLKDNLAFAKYRTLPPQEKDFRSTQGRDMPLFNQNAITKGMDELFFTEGECLTPDTEILTREGWVRFDHYSGQEVAQWNEGVAEFVKPLAVVKKLYSGNMVRFTTKTNVIDLCVTEQHRVLYNDTKGRKEVRLAKDVPHRRAAFYRTAMLTAAGIPLSDWDIRLAVAIQADFSLENGNRDKTHHCSDGKDGWCGSFKKQRKIARIKEMLTELKIEFTEYPATGRGDIHIRFRTPSGHFTKVFPTSFYQMNADRRSVFTAELVLWDGHKAKDSGCMYQGVVKSNADLVQWAFAMNGVYANFGKYERDVSRQPLYWVNAVLSKKRGRQELTSNNIEKSTFAYSGYVYCVQVASSYIVTRRNGAICVTGNCDTMAMLSAGIEQTVGVPGADIRKVNWLTAVDRAAPKTIYTLYDNDKKGQEGAYELAIRLGIERVKNIVIPEQRAGSPDCATCEGSGEDLNTSTTRCTCAVKIKDINEWFKAGHTHEEFEGLKASGLANLRVDC